MNSVTTSLEHLAAQVRMWRYAERTSAQARQQRDAVERLQIARASRLY